MMIQSKSKSQPNWIVHQYHPEKILIIGGSGSGKTNVLLNLIKHQQLHTDKMYLYVEGLVESKYQLLINGRAKVEMKALKNQKVFIDYP